MVNEQTMKKLLRMFIQAAFTVRGRFFGRSWRGWNVDPLTRHIGMFQGADTDLSIRHDDYLYGDGKRFAVSSLDPPA